MEIEEGQDGEARQRDGRLRQKQRISSQGRGHNGPNQWERASTRRVRLQASTRKHCRQAQGERVAIANDICSPLRMRKIAHARNGECARTRASRKLALRALVCAPAAPARAPGAARPPLAAPPSSP
eukprot:683936-Pleurochrysis_carterae.AAC.4